VHGTASLIPANCDVLPFQLDNGITSTPLTCKELPLSKSYASVDVRPHATMMSRIWSRTSL
jgi:hypothetical protein